MFLLTKWRTLFLVFINLAISIRFLASRHTSNTDLLKKLLGFFAKFEKNKTKTTQDKLEGVFKIV